MRSFTISISIFLLIPVLVYGQDRTIKEVRIDAAGLSHTLSDKNSIEGCKEFKPSTVQIEHYFKHAFPVEGYMMNIERYSPCYATGSVTFSDNTSATWSLMSSGVSSFEFDSGEHLYLYYKYNRWLDVAACTYGLSDELTC